MNFFEQLNPFHLKKESSAQKSFSKPLIDFDRFLTIAKKLHEHKIESDQYLDKLAAPFNTALLDNPVVSGLHINQEFLLKEILGEQLAEDLAYFLNEPKENAFIVVNETRYSVDTLSKYADYVKKVYFSE